MLSVFCVCVCVCVCLSIFPIMWSHPHTQGIGNTGRINFRTHVPNKVAKTWTRWMIWLSNVMNRHSINRVDNRNRIGLSAALFLLAQPFSLKLARCQIQIQSLRFFFFFFMFGLDLQPNALRSWLGSLTYTNKMCYFPQALPLFMLECLCTYAPGCT